MSEGTTHLRQVVGYVDPERKKVIEQMIEYNHRLRLSQSYIVSRALEIAWGQLLREFLPTFKSPAQGRPGRN